MMQLTDRERRLLALALLVALVTLVTLGIVMPIADGFTARAQERQELLETYARNSRLISGLPVWRRQIVAQRQASQQFALTAAGDAAAAEQLREKLMGLVTQLGGEVTAVDPLPGSPQMARAKLRGRLTLAQLNGLLRAVQEQPPVMAVEAVSISAEQAFSTGQLSPMDVQIDLAARYIPPAPR